MEEKEAKKQENLTSETEKKIKKRKGYSTVLAHIVGILRKSDIKKAAELSETKKTTLIKRFLKSLGWSEKEVTTMGGEIKGKEQNDISEKDIINVKTLKENEINVEVNQKISGIEESSAIKFQDKNYFVLNIISNDQKQTITYHLKEC